MKFKERKPRIVAIGGGTGLSTFLQGLKFFPVEITAIVTVADNGGSSGVLRDDLKIPPPGDIRNVLVALSNSPEQLQKLLQFRFEQTDEKGMSHYLNGHPVGNLILAAMTQIYQGDFNLAVSKTAEMLNVNGTVYPVSHSAVELCGECVDGTIVRGEANFCGLTTALNYVYYENEMKTSPGVLEAILAADVIVLGPGSLYTSVLPNLIVPQVSEAIAKNKKADVVYISNIMTEAGETDNYDVEQHVEALFRHGIKKITKVIVNDQKISKNVLKAYEEEAAVEVKLRNDDGHDYELIFSRVAKVKKGIVRHDPIKISAAIYSIAVEHI
ncbi:CofD superfamily transferase [Erysipelotrichaceae bacterium]|nr:CofD superfamily transferase [Erysipelotrichaceae bacterium]